MSDTTLYVSDIPKETEILRVLRNRHLSEERQILELYEKGLSIEGVKRTLGVSGYKVRSTLLKHKIPIRPAEHYTPMHEWRPLIKKTKRKGKKRRIRQITIPVQLIEEAGFDPSSELEGKWEATYLHLILHMREVGESAPSKSPTG